MKKKKLKLIPMLIIILIIIVIVLFAISKLTTPKDKPKANNSKELIVNFKDINNIEINEQITNESLIDNVSNGKLVSEIENIDTSILGTKTIIFKIEDLDSNIKEYTKEITIVDTTPPDITYETNLKTKEGIKIDLLKNVKATDNSKENINVSISGEYNFNKAGEYNIIYIAKDSSGNETKKEATLVVNEKKKVEDPEPKPQTPTTTDKTFTTSKGFKGVTKNGLTYIDGILIANKTYSLPSSYAPGFDSTTQDAFYKMAAAAKLDGINIYCQSSFRSYDTQYRLYHNYAKRDGYAAADTYSARPGNSEHQTGLSCDICSGDTNTCINSNFDNTNEAKWASKNAYKYGLILRYPKNKSNETGYKYESWHFRYVGVDLATKLYNNGDWITLEDYFGITSEYND